MTLHREWINDEYILRLPFFPTASTYVDLESHLSEADDGSRVLNLQIKISRQRKRAGARE